MDMSMKECYNLKCWTVGMEGPHLCESKINVVFFTWSTPLWSRVDRQLLVKCICNVMFSIQYVCPYHYDCVFVYIVCMTDCFCLFTSYQAPLPAKSLLWCVRMCLCALFMFLVLVCVCWGKCGVNMGVLCTCIRE